MPDSRGHRGAHPDDPRDFAPGAHDALRAAAFELSFLLERSYAIDASLKLVGDHHQLTFRQRKAVSRGACAERARQLRSQRRLRPESLRGRTLAVDGFNCLITVEAMLSEAPLFRGRDGALRDLASVHGTYRSVAETDLAASQLVELLCSLGPEHVLFLFDRPVGNSGRTRALFEATCAEARLAADVVLSDQVDRDLVASGRAVASSDGWILDHAPAWVDLPAALLEARAEECWLVDFSEAAGDGPA